jgi:hypothetical protein
VANSRPSVVTYEFSSMASLWHHYGTKYKS